MPPETKTVKQSDSYFKTFEDVIINRKPDIVVFAQRPETTASILYWMNHDMGILCGEMECIPSGLLGYILFYSDCVVVWSALKEDLITLPYGKDDGEIVRLPYPSTLLVEFWKGLKSQPSISSVHSVFMRFWFALENLQQVRWFERMDPSSYYDVGVEMNRVRLMYSKFNSAVNGRMCVVLDNFLKLTISRESQHAILTLVACLITNPLTQAKVKLYMKRYVVDAAFKPFLSKIVMQMIRIQALQQDTSKSQPERGVRPDAVVRRWQRAINLQVKRNRHERVQTALNRVERRKREIVRERCKAAREHAGPDPEPVRPGASGTETKVAWVAQELPGPSSRAKREARKKIAHEAILANAETKRAQAEQQARILAERMRNLQIAHDILNE